MWHIDTTVIRLLDGTRAYLVRTWHSRFSSARTNRTRSHALWATRSLSLPSPSLVPSWLGSFPIWSTGASGKAVGLNQIEPVLSTLGRWVAASPWWGRITLLL